MKTLDLHSFIKELLTPLEQRQLFKMSGAREIYEKITTPKIADINRITEQENDPMYFAYALEYYIRERRKHENTN